MMNAWQRKSVDGPKGGWSCVMGYGCNGRNGHVTHTPAGCGLVWCSCNCHCGAWDSFNAAAFAVAIVVVVWCK